MKFEVVPKRRIIVCMWLSISPLNKADIAQAKTRHVDALPLHTNIDESAFLFLSFDQFVTINLSVKIC